MTEKSQSSPTINSPFPSHYIGIGASAGGLEALQKLFQHLPTDTGASFIVVQHLSPDFKSMMQELLSKHTAMPIKNVEDGERVKPNTIYLIPPKKNMLVAQGQLMLSDKVLKSGLNLPIDIFFRSLAEDQQHKAIGIILSGTGSDGSSGIKALKEAGALVIAQEPASAKFDGMPNSAIKTGIIDLILTPEDMGLKLDSYIRHPLVRGDMEPLKENLQGNEDVMAEVFIILKIKSEIDFSKYKPATVARRIERRMTIKQLTSLQEYLTLLFKDPQEAQILSKELLIGVTRFFRDDSAFEIITDEIIPKIIERSEASKPIRVWSAACSTGEEAYSLAILFANELKRQSLVRTVKIFATDVNAESITRASNGIYSENIEHDVSESDLASHFVKVSDTTYQISKEIRQMVIFATHNITIDPPFSNMDLVTCRNILIYFQSNLQKKVLTSLHFSLRKLGYLFLGSSENLGDLTPHFEVLSDRHRIFQKGNDLRLAIDANPPAPPQSSQVSSQPIPSVSRLMRGYKGVNASASAINFANESLITQYAPPCILLSEQFEALHVYGDVTRFIRRLPPGRISVDIHDLVNEDISIAVSSALHRAKSSEQEVFYTDIYTQYYDQLIGLNLRVRYLKEHAMDTAPGFYWLIFEENETVQTTDIQSIPFDATEQSRQRVDDLEVELKKSKERLQVTVEELETTNEELQSSNEELMSANEELQSTNEELQSVNEELYTVNTEYQEKITEISQTNNDLDEVLNLSKIGIIFLDENMKVRRYTHAAAKYINLRQTDINRPLHHISKNIEYDQMLADVEEVFSTGNSIEHEIIMDQQHILKTAIIPCSYTDSLNSKGVAITFNDISKIKNIEKGMVVAYSELRKSINNALEVLDTSEFAKNVNILIVDDNEADQKALHYELKQISAFNVTTFTATNIADAKVLLETKPIDVCLTDYYLHNETALDLIDELTKDKISVPVVVLTALLNNHLNSILLSHGVLDLLDKKEISAILLSKTIRYAIRRHQINDKIDKVIGSASSKGLSFFEQ